MTAVISKMETAEIRPRLVDGDALCVTGCPRLTVANGMALSACAHVAQDSGYCGPWYREQVKEFRRLLAEQRAEREKANAERDAARRELCETLAHSWISGGCVPKAVSLSDWFNWDAEQPEYLAWIAVYRGWAYLYAECLIADVCDPDAEEGTEGKR